MLTLPSKAGRARWTTSLTAAAVAVVGLLVNAPSVGATSHAADPVVTSVVDLGHVVQRTDPSAIGFGSSTYGANPLSSAAQSDMERRLDARYVRLPVGYRNGRVTSSAAGASTTLDMPALVRRYQSWGYRVLVVIGGRTTDTDVQPGDATQIIRALGTGPGVDYSAPNEPNNVGQTVDKQLATARMIMQEGRALDPGFVLWGPVWSWYDRASLRAFAGGMGSALGGVDYHHYAMGTSSISTAQAMQETPAWGREVREVRADLASLGLQAPVNVDELNFSWRYQDGTPGGNNRFFTGINTVWMTSVLGHILEAGGRGMPYASQNGPLGITVEAGQVNPDGRPASSPMPAFWGIASWTGAGIWPHYKDTMYDATSSDPTAEVFAVNNEAGGYNVVLVNKSESDTKDLRLDLRNLTTSRFTAYQTDGAAPYDAPRQVATGTYVPGQAQPMTLPPMSVTVLVLGAGASSEPATPPSAPSEVTVLPSADRTSVSLHWQPPASDGGSPVTAYRVARNGADTTGGGAFETDVPASQRQFTFTLLDPTAAYAFTVRAVNAAGAGPATARTVEPLVVPSVPSAPEAVTARRDAKGTRVTVTWLPHAGAGPVTGYRVALQSSDATSTLRTVLLAPDARSWTFTRISARTSYLLSVRAVNDVGTGPATTTTSTGR